MELGALVFFAEAVDDIERTRIANENRLRSLTTTLGYPASHPDVIWLVQIVHNLAAMEEETIAKLRKELHKLPIYPWLKAQKGVGDKQAARLLSVIGDPYDPDPEYKPRRLSELWQFCGHGDPSRSRKQRGERVTYSPKAKMRVHLIAGKMLQCGNRETYDKRKAATEGREHDQFCVRCGPAGKPAKPGSKWSDGHRHADALRIVGKEFLRELWRESKRLQGRSGDGS